MTGPFALFGVVAVVLFAAVVDAQSDEPAPENIIRGTEAAPGEFPYMVWLLYKQQNLCGGAIIQSRHIVTAGHCVEGIEPDMYSDLHVSTGSVLSFAGKSHRIKSIIIHPKYYNRQLDATNDIAIIELHANIEFDENQALVELPTEPVPAGVLANFTGWGYEYMHANAAAAQLMKMKVKILSNEECRRYWDGRSDILSVHICTLGDNGVGVCNGDSGGPLVYNGKLIGIASYAMRCALGYPDVYTNVYHYTTWINSIMEIHYFFNVLELSQYSVFPVHNPFWLLRYSVNKYYKS